MSTSATAIASADRLRERHEPEAALEAYTYIYAHVELTNAEKRHVAQMAGVCLGSMMKGRVGEAMAWYARALGHAVTDQERGNIGRDQAMAQMRAGNFDEAERYLNEAWGWLKDSGDRVGVLATDSFSGRLDLARARRSMREAYATFRYAQYLLPYEGNRKVELYCLLHFLELLAYDHRFWQTRWYGLRAVRLAHAEGGRPHQLKAWSLFLGGWKLYRFTQLVQRT